MSTIMYSVFGKGPLPVNVFSQLPSQYWPQCHGTANVNLYIVKTPGQDVRTQGFRLESIAAKQSVSLKTLNIPSRPFESTSFWCSILNFRNPHSHLPTHSRGRHLTGFTELRHCRLGGAKMTMQQFVCFQLMFSNT